MKEINPIIVIPARLAATRLPNKPLRLINNTPMIIHVVQRALEADFAKVLVASGDKEISDLLDSCGIESVLTSPSSPSGSDRINQALEIYDPNEKYNIVINLQGDLPTIEKTCIQGCFNILKTDDYHISTLGVKIDINDQNYESDIKNPNIVKALVEFDSKGNIGNAIAFKREVNPEESKNCFHHIGIYGYKRESLKRFTSLTPSKNELLYKLEQLRALDNGMKIGFLESKTIPIGVDTEEDLEKASKYLSENIK